MGKRVHTFSNGLCLKVNVISRMEFELAYIDSIVQHFNHDPMGILSNRGSHARALRFCVSASPHLTISYHPHEIFGDYTA